MLDDMELMFPKIPHLAKILAEAKEGLSTKVLKRVVDPISIKITALANHRYKVRYWVNDLVEILRDRVADAPMDILSGAISFIDRLFKAIAELQNGFKDTDGLHAHMFDKVRAELNIA